MSPLTVLLYGHVLLRVAVYSPVCNEGVWHATILALFKFAVRRHRCALLRQVDASASFAGTPLVAALYMALYW